ncbi:ferrochelatase [Salmonella enterica subsp. enterica serovar Heidelberg str. RI-11-014316]|nr:ferrochelatase [Salmonella enterica subsp. enterica serovar Heidelberg str. RI-11-014316]
MSGDAGRDSGTEPRDFLEAGGKKYAYIPALNATPEHIDMMLKLTAPYR